MAVETVVGDVDLAALEPFCMRLVPFENGVPFSEPVQIFGLFCPKAPDRPRPRVEGFISSKLLNI